MLTTLPTGSSQGWLRSPRPSQGLHEVKTIFTIMLWCSFPFSLSLSTVELTCECSGTRDEMQKQVRIQLSSIKPHTKEIFKCRRIPLFLLTWFLFWKMGYFSLKVNWNYKYVHVFSVLISSTVNIIFIYSWQKQKLLRLSWRTNTNVEIEINEIKI